MQIAARNAFTTGGGAPLPYDAEVEYLESTGTQWIDTGFKANTGTTTFEIALVPVDTSGTRGVFGSRNAGGAYSFCAFIISGYFRGDFVGASRNLVAVPQVGQPYVVSWNGQTAYVNGVADKTREVTGSVAQLYDFLLFNFSNTSPTPYSAGYIGRIKYAKIWDGGDLVRDMVAVRFTNESNQSEGAMYNRISGQIFRNQGTGAFIIGPDK